MTYRIHSGLVAGRSHILDGRNCQDALHTVACQHNEDVYHVGALADGCSEGKHSEIGAQFVVRFVTHDVCSLLQRGIAPIDIPALVFRNLIDFLKNIVCAYHFPASERIAFVREHLLCTLLGCIVSEQTTVVFAAGDGMIILNDQVYVLDQQNAPFYIGYHILEQAVLIQEAEPLPDAFEVYTLPHGQMLSRLAIGSDAWIAEQALLLKIWGNRGRADLQMRMNVWSDARHLKDDAALIVIERAAVQ